MKKILAVALIFMAALSTISLAVAAYEINSNHVSITVRQRPGLTLTASTTDVMEGFPITLTATLSDQANGVVVTLYDGGVLVEQKSSCGGGIAVFTVTATLGTHDYWAVASHP